MRFLLVTLSLAWFVSLSGCLSDADRNNPLDQQASSFRDVGTITGQVLTLFSPFRPIADVRIFLGQAGRMVTTNASGQFQFDDIPAGSYSVLVEKDGFAGAADSVEVVAGKVASMQFNLDGLPFFVTTELSTCHVGRWFPLHDLFLLQVQAELDDSDGVGDVVMVELEIPELGYRDTLNVTETVGVFRKSISESRLPGKNLHDVFGRQIILTATDRAGFHTQSAPIFLVRIIEKTPLPDSPQGFDLLDSRTPELVWLPTELSFDYTQEVELFRVNFGLNTLIWQQGGIPDTSLSVTVPDSLPDGTYFWTIAFVDEFENCSRSKEASFRLQ
ncbi:MAG: carboxypeptidase-like regulatory domain-containing protein [bacterium]